MQRSPSLVGLLRRPREGGKNVPKVGRTNWHVGMTDRGAGVILRLEVAHVE
jgi:hypothetical protein